jgi:hypothetical protein
MSERTRKRSRKAEEGLQAEASLDDLSPIASDVPLPGSFSAVGGADIKKAGKSTVTSGGGSNSSGSGGGNRKPRKPLRAQLDDTLDLFKMAIIGNQRSLREGNNSVVRDGLVPLKVSAAQLNTAGQTAATLLSLSGGSAAARSIPRIGNLDGSAGGVVPVPLQSKIHDNARSFVKTLSNPLVRRWIRSEFLYSGVDRGFFLRNEFVECLADMGLAHVTKLTRLEWSAVKGRLGRPRVLSKTFLEQERGKLERYRIDMRRVQMSLLPRASTVDGPFVYLCPKPMSPGQRATCPHPLYRQVLSTCTVINADIKSGTYIVQFDRSSDGTYRVSDTDVFPHGDMEILYPALSSIPLANQHQQQDQKGDKSAASSSSSTLSSSPPRSTAGIAPSHYVPYDTWRLGHDTGYNLTTLNSSLLPAKILPQGANSFADRSSLLVISEDGLKSLSPGPIETTPPPPMVSPTTLALCSIEPNTTPLPAFGQPVRVAISDEADIVLRAFSTFENADRRRPGASSSSSSFSYSSTSSGAAGKAGTLSGALAGSAQQRSLPLALAGSATAAAQALPLLPLQSLGSATAAVVSYAAHCASALSAAHADEMRLSSSLNSILLRKDALLEMMKQSSSTKTTGGGGVDQNDHENALSKELIAINASAEIHFKALRRLARTKTRAANGASTALEAAGLSSSSSSTSSTSTPSIGNRFLNNALTRSSSTSSSSSELNGGQNTTSSSSSFDMSPFISVALSSAEILSNDPTITGQAGLAFLQPQAAERLDGIRIRSSHKASKASARAIRNALLSTTPTNLTASVTSNAGGRASTSASSSNISKGLLDLACNHLLSSSVASAASSKGILSEDGEGEERRGGVPVISAINSALSVLLAMQSASDPGCGLSAVEGYVAVQRALSSVAPVHPSNAKLFQDLCASTAALRSLGQL